MRAGQLDDRMKIWRSTVTKNAAGEDVTTWQVHREIRCGVKTTPKDRAVQNSETVFPHNKTFFCRSYQQVTDNDRVEHEGKMYRILSLLVEKRLQQLTIECELLID